MKRLIKNGRPIKVLLVGDNPIYTSQIYSILSDEIFEKIGTANTLSIAEELFMSCCPDIVISDVTLGDENIFDLFLRDKFLETPILFVADIVDDELFQKSNHHPRSILLLKPYHQYTLLSSMKLLLNAYPPKGLHFVEVRSKNQQILRISLDDILFVEADGNYTFIHTLQNRVYARKKTLKKIKEELNDSFLQINKSYIINTAFIKRIELGKGVLLLHNREIKIGRGYRNELDDFFKRGF